MNKSIMMGRLVRDPDIRRTEGQNGELAIANFRLAVDRKYAKEDAEVKADFFPCTAFGRWAEFAEKYLFQGIKIVVQGRMQNDNYTNRDGDRVYGVCLMVDDIDFAESKSASAKIREENEADERGSDSRRSSSSERSSSGGNAGRSSRNSRSQESGHSSRREEPSDSRNSSRSSSRSSARNTTRSSSRSNRDPDDKFMDMDEYDEENLGFD